MKNFENETENNQEKKWKLLLSSDSLSWYWLDLVFHIASYLKFDWIDLAIRKNFDSRSIWYITKLIEKYWIWINVIQLSDKCNKKELDYWVELAREIWADVISINPPSIFNYKTYKYICDNLAWYKKHHKSIKFSIINPPKSSLFLLPVPNYYFSNIVEIIKTYNAYLWLDISNIDEIDLETKFLKKLSNFISYIPIVYISDKDKNWIWHIWLWSWVLKLPTILKKFKQNEYKWYFSLKIEISKKDLADMDKIEQILKKCKAYFDENYKQLIIN